MGYVYSPAGQLMAKQVTGQYGYLAWKYGTAAGASEYETYNNASYVNRTELDPLGASVPLDYTPPPEVQNEGDIGPGGAGGIFDSRWSNFFDVSGGCTAEGVSASCRDAASSLNNLGVARPNLILVTIRITWQDRDKKPQIIQFVTTSNVIRSGFNHTFTGGAAVAAAGAWNRGLSGGLDNALLGAIYAGLAAEVDQIRRHHAPQNSHDPRVDFRNYAFMLSGNGEDNDCLKLALLIYKAGQAWGGDPRRVVSGLLNGLTERAGIIGESDSNYRVGVMRRDSYYGNSFGSGGFLPQYQGGPRDNQVRHFIGWFGAGFNVPSFLARRELYSQEGTSDPRDPDVALGLAGIQMGSSFSITNYEGYKDLAQRTWHDICGGKGDLILP